MQTKLIKTKDYLLLIDEEAEIKENTNTFKEGFNGDWFWCSKYNSIQRIGDITEFDFKIIAYYPLNSEAKELDLPLLPNPFEIDTYKMFEIVDGTCEKGGYEHWLFDQGYMAAQSKQFSLEDMQKAIEMARGNSGRFRLADDISFDYTEEEILQSLSTQQLPKEFIPNYGTPFVMNSEGKQELVGTYKY